MRCQVFLLLLISISACSEDLTLVHLDGFHQITEEPKNGYYKKVVNPYHGIDGRPNHRRFERLPEIVRDISVSKSFPPIEKISPMQLEDSAHLDRIDFHYPDRSEELASNFGSFVDGDPSENDKYVFMQSQKLVADEDEEEDDKYGKNKRPVFETSKNKQTGSYIQKIPKATTPSDTHENRYEELNIKSTNSPTTKSRINRLLQRYLGKLYEKKYNTISDSPPGISSRLEQEKKTKKILSTNIFSKLKNKAIDKINKIFSLFTIVQFNNTQCIASSTAGVYQGVCYTASQCSSEGGSALGNCASGYGVCCVCEFGIFFIFSILYASKKDTERH